MRSDTCMWEQYWSVNMTKLGKYFGKGLLVSLCTAACNRTCAHGIDLWISSMRWLLCCRRTEVRPICAAFSGWSGVRGSTEANRQKRSVPTTRNMLFAPQKVWRAVKVEKGHLSEFWIRDDNLTRFRGPSRQVLFPSTVGPFKISIDLVKHFHMFVVPIVSPSLKHPRKGTDYS